MKESSKYGLKCIIAYARISYEETNNSIENQMFMIKEYIDNNFIVDEKRVISVEDRGYSGSNIYRPGMIKILELINTGEVSYIIIKDISRLCRNYIDLGTIIDLCKEKNVKIISIIDNGDITNSKEEILTDFIGILADFYSKDISIKTKSALDIRKNKGVYAIANVPYGYKKNRNEIFIDKEEAKIVRMIYDLYIDGKNINHIRRVLREKKIYTPKKKSTYWSYSTIKQMLTNEFYTGKMIYSKTSRKSWESNIRIKNKEIKVIDNHHEKIISEDIFYKASIKIT